MKIRLLFLTCIPLLFCRPVPFEYPAPVQKKDSTKEIIADPDFTNGVLLLGTNSARPAPIGQWYPFGKGNTEAVWTLAQWGSRFDLSGTKPIIKEDSVIYENKGKRVAFFRSGNSTTVNLEVIGSEEYDSPRKENEGWPHLLFGQDFKDQTSLDKIKRLTYCIDTRLIYNENKMGAAFRKKMHTSQVSLYLSIQNTNKHSASYRDFFWFGLPIYDYRYRNIPEYAAQDLGKEDATKKFILNVASKSLFKGSLQDKQWISTNADIYPLLYHAFQKAQKRGFLKGSSWSDMSITSTNIGWEVPGTFNCGLQFKNLKLTASL